MESACIIFGMGRKHNPTFFDTEQKLYYSHQTGWDRNREFAVWSENISDSYFGTVGKSRYAKFKSFNSGNSYVNVPLKLLQTAASDCRLISGLEDSDFYVLVPATYERSVFNVLVSGNSFLADNENAKKSFSFSEWMWFSEYLWYAAENSGSDVDGYAALQSRRIFYESEISEIETFFLTETEFDEIMSDYEDAAAGNENFADTELTHRCDYCGNIFQSRGNYSETKKCFSCFVVSSSGTLVG